MRSAFVSQMRGIEGSIGGSGVSCAEPPVSTAFTTESGVHAAAGGRRTIWAWAMAARAVAATAGSYQKGFAVFTAAKGGLMYEATIGGQKFGYKPAKK